MGTRSPASQSQVEKQLNDKQCQIQIKNRTNQSKISLNFKLKRLVSFLSKVGSQNCDAGERQVTWEVENPLGFTLLVCLLPKCNIFEHA